MGKQNLLKHYTCEPQFSIIIMRHELCKLQAYNTHERLSTVPRLYNMNYFSRVFPIESPSSWRGCDFKGTEGGKTLKNFLAVTNLLNPLINITHKYNTTDKMAQGTCPAVSQYFYIAHANGELWYKSMQPLDTQR